MVNPRSVYGPIGLTLMVSALASESFAGPESAAELAKAKLEAAREAYKASVQALQTGKADAEKVYVWSRRWLEAQADQSGTRTDRAAFEAHLQRMKELRKLATTRYHTGLVPVAEVIGTDFYVAEAGLCLERAKAK